MGLPLAFPLVSGIVGTAGFHALKKAEENSPKKKREAKDEIKRESRGVEKPVNFDAMQESIQDAKDAKDRKKISDMGYAGGGKVSSASKRGDGCITKGKTKGTMITMKGGGYAC